MCCWVPGIEGEQMIWSKKGFARCCGTHPRSGLGRGPSSSSSRPYLPSGSNPAHFLRSALLWASLNSCRFHFFPSAHKASAVFTKTILLNLHHPLPTIPPRASFLGQASWKNCLPCLPRLGFLASRVFRNLQGKTSAPLTTQRVFSLSDQPLAGSWNAIHFLNE